jgi:hypothetical protein
VVVIGDPCSGGELGLGPCASDRTNAIVVTVCLVLAVIVCVLALAYRYRVWPMSRLIQRRDRIVAELDAKIAARGSSSDTGRHTLTTRPPDRLGDSSPNEGTDN